MGEITHKNITLLNSIASLQLSCGRASAALPLLRLSQKLFPTEPKTKYLLAKAYFQIGDLEQSRAYFDEFERLTLSTLTTKDLIFKSLLLLREGYLAQARDVFKLVIKK